MNHKINKQIKSSMIRTTKKEERTNCKLVLIDLN